jgi:hypothetical protein
MPALRSISTAVFPFFMTVLMAWLLFLPVSSAFAFDIGGIGERSAGTYLSVEGDESTIMQISKDGNLSLIFSDQFSGGVFGDPFSNTLGSWKRSGKRELTANAADITFDATTKELVGVGAAIYVIKFDKWFRSAIMTCQGAIYAPGVNPFSPGATPIPDSDFTCGDEGLVFHRLPLKGHKF